MTETQEEARELRLVLEDCIEYYCNENHISGEKAWVMTNAISLVKMSGYPDVKAELDRLGVEY